MNKARILIIDDQHDVRLEVKERIEALGHESDEAASLEEALQKIESMQYECVLLDLAIPVKLEGVPRVDHGKNLLQRIVALPDAPPVLVITSNGLDGHKLAVEVMKIGAKSFVGKPFDSGPLESEIQSILDGKKERPSDQSPTLKPFAGGALILNEDGIELCGVLVGGVRVDAAIRGVVRNLSIKKHEKYVKASAKSLASLNTGSNSPASLTASIKEFREQCCDKLRRAGIECGKYDVIQTGKGGGYQFCEWIQVRLGREGELSTEAKEDCKQVMRVFNRQKKLTVKELRNRVQLTAVRIQAATATLEERGTIKNAGGSGSTTTYEVVQASGQAIQIEDAATTIV